MLVIDAEQMKNGLMKVVNVNAAGGYVIAELDGLGTNQARMVE